MMKKIILALALLISFSTIGQEHEEKKEHRRKGPAGLKMKMHKKPDFSPEQMATLKTKKMALELDLDKSQQNQLQKFNEKNIKERRTLMEKMKEHKKSGEKKSLTSDQKFEMANERLDRAIAQKKELKRILGEEKFKKHQALQKKRKAMAKRKVAARKKQMAMKKKKMAMRRGRR